MGKFSVRHEQQENYMGTHQSFGEILQKYIFEKNITVTNLSNALRIPRSTVYRWINGETKPHHTMVRKLNRVLKLNAVEKKQLFSSAGYDEAIGVDLIDVDGVPTEEIVIQSGEERARISKPKFGKQVIIELAGIKVTVERIATIALFIILGSLSLFYRDRIVETLQRIFSVQPRPTPQIIEPTPTPDAEEWRGQGYILVKEGKFVEALAAYDQAIALEPAHDNIDDIYFSRGHVHQTLGNLDQAIADYSKAIELTLDHPESNYARGLIYRSQGKLDEALADFNTVIETLPRFASAYNARGLIYRSQGKLDEALADFNTAIELKPDLTTAYYNRGLVLKEQGKLIEALSDFRRYLELQPNAPNLVDVQLIISEIETERAKQK